jgi:hypothetical protein
MKQQWRNFHWLHPSVWRGGGGGGPVNPLEYLASLSQNCDVHPLVVVTEKCVLSLARMLGGYVDREYPEAGHVARIIGFQRIS